MQALNQNTLTILDIKELITFCKTNDVYDFRLGGLQFSLERKKPQFFPLEEMAPTTPMTPAQQRAEDDKLMFMSSL